MATTTTTTTDGLESFIEGVFVGGIGGVIANDLAEVIWDILDPAVEKACKGMEDRRKSQWKRIVRLVTLVIMAYFIVNMLKKRQGRSSQSVGAPSK